MSCYTVEGCCVPNKKEDGSYTYRVDIYQPQFRYYDNSISFLSLVENVAYYFENSNRSFELINPGWMKARYGLEEKETSLEICFSISYSYNNDNKREAVYYEIWTNREPNGEDEKKFAVGNGTHIKHKIEKRYPGIIGGYRPNFLGKVEL